MYRDYDDDGPNEIEKTESVVDEIQWEIFFKRNKYKYIYFSIIAYFNGRVHIDCTICAAASDSNLDIMIPLLWKYTLNTPIRDHKNIFKVLRYHRLSHRLHLIDFFSFLHFHRFICASAILFLKIGLQEEDTNIC